MPNLSQATSPQNSSNKAVRAPEFIFGLRRSLGSRTPDRWRNGQSFGQNVVKINDNSLELRDNDAHINKSIINIDKNITDTIAFVSEKLASLSPERQKQCLDALGKLADDARLPEPTLLPRILDSAAKPGNLVTQVSPAPAKDFPQTAPEKWTPKPKGRPSLQADEETPEAFAVRVYGKWMRPNAPHLSIGMSEILHLDKPLWDSLRRSNRTEKPNGFFLPSKKERNDAKLALWEKGSLPMPADTHEYLRLMSAASYRRHK